MIANSLPVPCDRIIPATVQLPQFAVQYQNPTAWQQYIPVITQQCATIISNEAQRNPVRAFAYNMLSSNGWQNQDFLDLVIFAIEFLSWMSDTNQVHQDLNTTITSACTTVVQGISVMYLQQYPMLQHALDPNSLQQSQLAINDFNQKRQQVAQWRTIKQQQMGMQPGMGMMPNSGMMLNMGGVGVMGADPRLNAAGNMGMMPMQQPMMMGVGGVSMPVGQSHQQVQKTMVTMQRMASGGTGRWNAVTDSSLSNRNTGSVVGIEPNAFEKRSGIAIQKPATPSTIAPLVSGVPKNQPASQPPMTSESTMTSINYAPDYFRPQDDDPQIRAMVMTRYRRMLENGELPEGALSPYDTPPAPEVKQPTPSTQASEVEDVVVKEVRNGTPRETTDSSEGDSSQRTFNRTAPELNVDASPQAQVGQWWNTDDDDNDIPQPVHDNVSSNLIKKEPVAEAGEFTYEDENHIYRWSPCAAQWYPKLYHPSRQMRLIKVYKDDRPNEQVVLARQPEFTPDMEYANHVLNSPFGHRKMNHESADMMLAAQEKMKVATESYHSTKELSEAAQNLLENPQTSFAFSTVSIVEGAESSAWLVNNVAKQVREKEIGKEIDIFVSNAVLYEAYYCQSEDDRVFLRALSKYDSFNALHAYLEEQFDVVSKGAWELANKRATVMLNQTLTLSMSLDSDTIFNDFYADFPKVDESLSNTPEVVKNAWKKAQRDQIHLFFYEMSTEEMKRNTGAICYFLPDETSEEHLVATQYLASIYTLTQLNVNAADLDIALDQKECAQITEDYTPVLHSVVMAVFDAMAELGDRRVMHHLIRTNDGVVYQITFGALMEDAILISRRQHLWVDAR